MENVNAMTDLLRTSILNPKYSWGYRCLSTKVGGFKGEIEMGLQN